MKYRATTTLSPLACATFLYNVVDSPVGIIPVTRVDPSKDKITPEFLEGPGRGSPLIEDGYYGKKKPVYDAEKMAGLPVGIQIVGRAWEDEKVIEMMRVVDDALALASASTDGEGDGEKRQRRRADLFGPGAWPPLPGSL